MEVEGLWSPTTYSDDPAGGHGCSLWGGHHSSRLQGLDKTFQNIFSTLPCKGRYLLWCRWESVAWQTGTSRSVDRLHCNSSYSAACKSKSSAQVVFPVFAFLILCFHLCAHISFFSISKWHCKECVVFWQTTSKSLTVSFNQYPTYSNV